MKLNVIQKFLGSLPFLFKVVYLFKEQKFEFCPRISVLKRFCFHLQEHVREVAAQVVELALVDASHGRVVRTLHGGASWLVR